MPKRYVEIDSTESDSFTFKPRDSKKEVTIALFKDKDGFWHAGIRTEKGRTLRKEEY